MDDSSIKISAIKPSTKVTGRFSIYINGRFFSSVTENTLTSLSLTVGRVLSQDEFEDLSARLSDRKLRDAAYRFLSQRQHSAHELSAKLKKRGFESHEISVVIAELTEAGYVDDRRFAESWIERRLRFKPRGARMLALELEAKGVERSVAHGVVREKFSETDESEVALRLLEANAARFSRENSVDTKRRICNFLRNRGFGSDSILNALKAFLKAADVASDE